MGQGVPLSRLSACGSAGTPRPASSVVGEAPKTAGEAPALPRKERTALRRKRWNSFSVIDAVGTPRPTAISGFSLIEIMMAVALMTVIMLGLLEMFYQTQP